VQEDTRLALGANAADRQPPVLDRLRLSLKKAKAAVQPAGRKTMAGQDQLEFQTHVSANDND
jgi:hypothetical protein